jgi:DNA-binding transcriptional LysR family regulator
MSKHQKDAPERDGYTTAPWEGDVLLRSGLKFIHLRMIVALDETKMVGAAALQLNISQPAASRMIAEMEAILKAPVCERLPRGVALTPFGAALARRSRAILLELRDTEREISDLRLGRGGSVIVGSVTAPAIDLVVPALNRVRARHPNIEVTLHVETSGVLIRELLASRVDFVIGRIPDDYDPRQFATRTIGLEYANLLVRSGHPLLGRRKGTKVTLADMQEYDWILQPHSSPLRRAVEALFMGSNIPLPARVMNTSSILLTMVLVAQSNAIAPIACQAAQFITKSNSLGLEILETDFPIEIQAYSLISSQSRSMSPAAAMLYREICIQAGLEVQ